MLSDRKSRALLIDLVKTEYLWIAASENIVFFLSTK